MGILTLNQVDNCMSVTTNRILCGVELSVGLIVVFLLVREIRRVPVLLRVMLSLHSIQTTFVIGVCAVALAEADPTIEASYALYSTAHVFFAFAISCRLYVLTRVVYMSASSPQRFFFFLLPSFCVCFCFVFLLFCLLFGVSFDYS